MTARRRLWLALAAPIVAWAVHGLAAVILVVEGCAAGRGAAARAAVLGLGAAALAVTAAAGASAVAARRRVAELEQELMLARVAAMTAVAFAIALSWNALPVLFIGDVCQVWR